MIYKIYTFQYEANEFLPQKGASAVQHDRINSSFI